MYIQYAINLIGNMLNPQLDPSKQEGIVYKLPSQRDQAYIGKPRIYMQQRIKEHNRDLQYAPTKTSTK